MTDRDLRLSTSTTTSGGAHPEQTAGAAAAIAATGLRSAADRHTAVP
jgi:hypothetical protein